MNRFTKLLAVAGVSGALAVGATGIAQASTDHGAQRGSQAASKADHAGSKRDGNGKKERKRDRDRKRERAHNGTDQRSGHQGEQHQYRHGSGH